MSKQKDQGGKGIAMYLENDTFELGKMDQGNRCEEVKGKKIEGGKKNYEMESSIM